MKEIKELKENIENIKINYNFEEVYNNLYNACIDYMNNTQTWDFEDIFENIVSYDFAEEHAQWELEQGGLIRLYYYLGDANLNNDIFKINGYGNLEDITIKDLERLKNELLEVIENLENEEK